MRDFEEIQARVENQGTDEGLPIHELQRKGSSLNDKDIIEKEIADLKRSGWIPKTSKWWKSPSGQLFLGPHGAWEVMMANRRNPLFKNGPGYA